MDESMRRRRRVRRGGEPESLELTVATTNEVSDEIGPADADGVVAERGLRGLIGSGSTQVSPTMALRARDAARPRPSDVARAETELVIVRRNWVPPTTLRQS